jgi:predicted transposase YdaD
MEVFVEDNAYNSKFPKTSAIKRRYKETEGGLDSMCEIMEELTTEAKAEGRAEVARRLIMKQGMSLDEIAEITDLPLELVEQIQQNMYGGRNN